MTQSDVARKYRSENKGMPTKKLARIMYADNNLLFANEERARFALCYIEGKAGKDNLRRLSGNPEFILTEARPYNPYNLPLTSAEDIKPYYARGYKRAFIINDVHLPFHDLTALSIAFDY